MSGGYVVNEDGTLRKPETMMTEPVLNRAALRFDAEGAELAARHYLALTEYAWATGDTGPMREFATDECATCEEMASAVDAMYRDGGWMSSISYHVNEVKRVELLDSSYSLPNTYGIAFDLRVDTGERYEDRELMPPKTTNEQLGLFVNWNGTIWRVCEAGALQDGAMNEASS